VGRGGPVGLDPRRDFKWKLIFEFQINFDFGKTLRISTRIFKEFGYEDFSKILLGFSRIFRK
jgi:hypothetical protein